MSFSLLASAQASGGQIKREVSKKNTSKSAAKQKVKKFSYSIPQVVDLGLPSGTLWADRNLGANAPEGYGHFFAWGEVASKKICSGANYKYVNWKENKLTKYCGNSGAGIVDGKTELDLDDDAAYINLGKNWRVPSSEQFEELVDSRYTKLEWCDVHTVKGIKITSLTNGNSLFLPASGFLSTDIIFNANKYGYYWARNLSSLGFREAYSLHISQFDIERNIIGKENQFGTRYYGQNIRPVYVL